MQCMMKEICAQCLQRHYDPATGTETVVFSCFNQDQELDRVDFRTLRRRLSQNGAQEKLTKLWVDRCLKRLGWREQSRRSSSRERRLQPQCRRWKPAMPLVRLCGTADWPAPPRFRSGGQELSNKRWSNSVFRSGGTSPNP